MAPASLFFLAVGIIWRANCALTDANDTAVLANSTLASVKIAEKSHSKSSNLSLNDSMAAPSSFLEQSLYHRHRRKSSNGGQNIIGNEGGGKTRNRHSPRSTSWVASHQERENAMESTHGKHRSWKQREYSGSDLQYRGPRQPQEDSQTVNLRTSTRFMDKQSQEKSDLNKLLLEDKNKDTISTDDFIRDPANFRLPSLPDIPNHDANPAAASSAVNIPSMPEAASTTSQKFSTSLKPIKEIASPLEDREAKVHFVKPGSLSNHGSKLENEEGSSRETSPSFRGKLRLHSKHHRRSSTDHSREKDSETENEGYDEEEEEEEEETSGTEELESDRYARQHTSSLNRRGRSKNMDMGRNGGEQRDNAGTSFQQSQHGHHSSQDTVNHHNRRTSKQPERQSEPATRRNHHTPSKHRQSYAAAENNYDRDEDDDEEDAEEGEEGGPNDMRLESMPSMPYYDINQPLGLPGGPPYIANPLSGVPMSPGSNPAMAGSHRRVARNRAAGAYSASATGYGNSRYASRTGMNTYSPESIMGSTGGGYAPRFSNPSSAYQPARSYGVGNSYYQGIGSFGGGSNSRNWRETGFYPGTASATPAWGVPHSQVPTSPVGGYDDFDDDYL
eukprot:jgi/Bigna1/76888/fgenesh1_pg.44_\